MAPNARWAVGGGRRKGRIEGSESLRKAGGSREALPPTKKTGTMACEEHSNRCARSIAFTYTKKSSHACQGARSAVFPMAQAALRVG